MKKPNISKAKFLIGAALALPFGSAFAFEVTSGDWTLGVNGNINASYISVDCDSASAGQVDSAFLCSGDEQNAITNGYLPTNMEISLKTNKGGYDISANWSSEGGLDANESFSANNGEAFRAWLTISNDDMGTVLAGRNYGVFGIDVILADMSLLGVGGNFLVNNPVNTQLGGAGTGYIFADRLTQFTYTFPTSEKFAAQLGFFSPQNISSFSAGGLAGADNTQTPGIHGKLRLNLDNGFISTTFLSQDLDDAASGFSDTGTAFDLTAQFDLGPVTLTGSTFTAESVGHTGLFIDAVGASASSSSGFETRDTDGYFIQATTTVGSTKYGINYGITNIDPTSGEGASTLVEEKTKSTVGVYHTMTSGVMLNAEYSNLEAENQAGGRIENDVFNVGLALFF